MKEVVVIASALGTIIAARSRARIFASVSIFNKENFAGRTFVLPED
jgi:hypothetical protein